MNKQQAVKLFEQKQVYTRWDDEQEKWDLINKTTPIYNSLNKNPMSTFSIYRTLIMILISLSFFSCDKNGNPYLSSYKFKCEINDVKYKDQMPLFLPPGAQRSPAIEYVKYKEDNYIQFASSITPEDKQTRYSEYHVIFRIPMEENISLGKTYHFEPIQGKEIINDSDNDIYLEGNNQFVCLTSSNDSVNTGYCGTGTVVFTEFNLVSQKAEGKVEFTFPYLPLDGIPGELKLKGEFACGIDKTY